MVELRKVSPAHALVAERVDAQWTAEYSLVVQGDSLIVSEVRIYPSAYDEGARLGMTSDGYAIPLDGTAIPRGGITSRATRLIRPPRAIRSLLSDPQAVIMLGVGGGDWRAAAEKATAMIENRSLPRRERLAVVAALYAHGIAEQGGRINARIADAFREAGVERTASQVRDDVYAARSAGLLSEGGGHGRAAGELTDKALRILDELRGETP